MLTNILPLNFPIVSKQIKHIFTLTLFVIAVRFSVGKLSKSSYIPHFSRSGCDTQALCVYPFKPITFIIRWNAYTIVIRVLVKDTLLTLTEFYGWPQSHLFAFPIYIFILILYRTTCRLFAVFMRQLVYVLVQSTLGLQ